MAKTEDEILEEANVDSGDGKDVADPFRTDVKLSNVDVIPGEDDAFKSITSPDINKDAVNVVAKNATEKLNLGLLLTTLDTVLEARRTKEKIHKLEDIIYAKTGLFPEKNVVALYTSEKATYATQVEIVRKYVLNNKSALDEFSKPVKDLVDSMMHLPSDKITELQAMVNKMVSDEGTVDKEDLLVSKDDTVESEESTDKDEDILK